MKQGRLLALSLGVAAPAVLLGAGWLYATVRERAAIVREQEALLSRSAAVVRGVVDESLEELREREDARPFYLYNHYYSPPDVLAVNDPVAVSPLAKRPDDERLVGWFQVEPGGTVRTPHADGPQAARVLEIARSSALVEVRAIAGDGAAPVTLLDGAPSGPLTVSLSQWGDRVAEDIQLAQAGSAEASYRVQQRGRSAPITNRNTIDWELAQQQQAMPREAPPREEPRPAPEPRSPRRGAARVTFDLRPAPDPRPVPAAAQQSLEEVDYTPMAFFEARAVVALHRIVSHEGTGVVQVALLDRAHLVERWIPEIVRRHAPTDVVPTVIETGTPADCAVRAPASELLTGIDLCVPAAPLRAATASIDRDLTIQASVLGVLLLAILLAVAAIHRATTRAEQLARERAAFVSAVSHELRTPLTTLRMHAEMLQDGLVSDARRPTVYADLVTESARLARLVENVLELSRLEEGRRPMQIREGRLGIYVSDLGEGLRRYIEQKGFTLRLVVPDTPVRASYDAQAVEQIVTNLVDNAIKYAASHEPREIELAVGLEGAFAFIDVRDRGPGIPESERERVFERFHRVDRPEHAHAPGTGIGLSLVRDFARSMGGDATVLGREEDGAEGAGGPRIGRRGSGTVIRVTLPRAE